MKPVAYGYLRVADDHEDGQIRQLEGGLYKLAKREGFRLASILYEYEPGCHGAFIELVEDLKRGQAHHVVIPSRDHLSTHPLLQVNRIMHLVTLGARVWIAES